MKSVFAALMLKTVLSQTTLFADGGYQNSFPECVTSWIYKEKLPDGSNLETSLTGCVSINDFKPSPFYENDQEAINALLAPQDSNTNTAFWCPVIRDVYNPTPLRTPENKFNWGYCLDTSATSPPATNSPTDSEEEVVVTSSPTDPEIATSSPTEEEEEEGIETDSPTEEEEEQTSSPTVDFEETDEPTEIVDLTDSPTTEVEGIVPGTDSPTTTAEGNEGNSESNPASLGQWTYVGIGVAVALLAIAIVLALFLSRNMKKKTTFMDEDVEENTNMSRA